MIFLSLSQNVTAQSDYISSLYDRANEAYDRGVEQGGEEKEKALRLAAANYEKIITQGQIENGYLYYNLGNAYFQLGELGKAIANYRRAERFLPNSTELRENLRTAISKRKDRIDKRQIDSIWQTLFFWHYLMSFRAKVMLFSVFFVLIWLLLFIKLFRRNPLIKWSVVVAAVLSVSSGMSFVFEAYSTANNKHGVITQAEVDAKKGPYTNAESEFKTPLHQGTEFRLIEKRGDWIRIRLENGVTTWILQGDCEII
jgi:tetratricopeptide (TPR) repeat protein